MLPSSCSGVQVQFPASGEEYEKDGDFNGQSIWKKREEWIVTSIGVGSMAHDSCCHASLGQDAAWCENGPMREMQDSMNGRGVLPPNSETLVCDDEWRRAAFDMMHNLNWNVVVPLSFAEALEIAFINRDSDERVRKSRNPSPRSFNLPQDPWNRDYRLETNIPELYITYPGTCTADEVDGVDGKSCGDAGNFVNALPTRADLDAMSELTQVPSIWRDWLYSMYSTRTRLLYKTAKMRGRAPKYNDLPANMDDQDPDAWKKFCNSEWVSAEKGTSHTGIIGLVTDSATSGTLVVSEKVWPIVYCGITADDGDRMAVSASATEALKLENSLPLGDLDLPSTP